MQQHKHTVSNICIAAVCHSIQQQSSAAVICHATRSHTQQHMCSRQCPRGRGAWAGRAMAPKTPAKLRAGKLPARAVKMSQQPLALLQKHNLDKLRMHIVRFGAKPPETSKMWRDITRAIGESELSKVTGTTKFLSGATQKQANAFVKAFESGKPLKRFRSWARNCRHRLELLPSLFDIALRSLVVFGHGIHRPNHLSEGKQVVINTASSPQLQQVITSEGHVPRCNIDTAIGVLGLTPYLIVNWLYQALVDVVRCLQCILGDGSFDSVGCFKGEGQGETLVMWGTHLGAVRDQGLVAWDYDVDLAVFCKPEFPFESAFKNVSKSLEILGYRCVQHGSSKFRVTPKKPLAWMPWKELYQQVRESNLGLSRPELVEKTASLWQQGQRAKSPHGSNCVDIELYKVKPGKPVTVMGSSSFRAPLDDFFPSVSGTFGPLQVCMPRTTMTLTKEYGIDCLQSRKAKFVSGNNHTKWVEVPNSVRRVAWPCKPLLRCDGLLS